MYHNIKYIKKEIRDDNAAWTSENNHEKHRAFICGNGMILYSLNYRFYELTPKSLLKLYKLSIVGDMYKYQSLAKRLLG